MATVAIEMAPQSRVTKRSWVRSPLSQVLILLVETQANTFADNSFNKNDTILGTMRAIDVLY